MRSIAVIMAVVAAALAASASAGAPRPVLGRSVLLERVSGRVLLEQPGGTGFVRVTRPVLARIGANVDTTNGHARLTAAEDLRARRLTRGTFYGGRFLLSQLRRAGAYVALGLEGGDFAVCASAASTRSSAQVRQVWAKSSGR